MLIMLDISRPFQKKIGYRKTDVGGKGWRVWWLWFAITYAPCSDYKYHEIVASGKTIWNK